MLSSLFSEIKGRLPELSCKVSLKNFVKFTGDTGIGVKKPKQTRVPVKYWKSFLKTFARLFLK